MLRDCNYTTHSKGWVAVYMTPFPPSQVLPADQIKRDGLSSVNLLGRLSWSVNQASAASQSGKMSPYRRPVKVTVADGGCRPQRRADLEGITEEDIGPMREREEGEVLHVLLECGEKEGMTLRAAAEVAWRRTPGRKAVKSGRWDQGRKRGGYTVANIVSKGRSIILL